MGSPMPPVPVTRAASCAGSNGVFGGFMLIGAPIAIIALKARGMQVNEVARGTMLAKEPYVSALSYAPRSWAKAPGRNATGIHGRNPMPALQQTNEGGGDIRR
jgi:hypothetical protein